MDTTEKNLNPKFESFCSLILTSNFMDDSQIVKCA